MSVGGVEVQEGKGECGWGGVGWRCRRVRVGVDMVEVQEVRVSVGGVEEEVDIGDVRKEGLHRRE